MEPKSTIEPKKPVLRDSHRKAVESLLDTTDGAFRRAALSQVLYSLTSPRSRQKSDQLADLVLKELSKVGRIQRQGHLHWIKVERDRTLRSGRTVPEIAGTATLTLTTHCPRKWLAVDMETGDVWVGDTKGWKRATTEDRQAAASCLNNRK